MLWRGIAFGVPISLVLWAVILSVAWFSVRAFG